MHIHRSFQKWTDIPFCITITENMKYMQTAIPCYRTALTNLSLMEFPVLIIWTNPFQILG